MASVWGLLGYLVVLYATGEYNSRSWQWRLPAGVTLALVFPLVWLTRRYRPSAVLLECLRFCVMSPFLFCLKCTPASVFKDDLSIFGIVAVISQSNCILVKGSYLTGLADQGQKLPRRQEVPREAVIHVFTWRIWEPLGPVWSSGCVGKCVTCVYIFLLLSVLVDTVWPFPKYPLTENDDHSEDWSIAKWNQLSRSEFLEVLWARLVLLLVLAVLCVAQSLAYAFILKVVVVSYLWLDPEHPDANGDQLKFLSHMLKAYNCDNCAWRSNFIRASLDLVAVFIDFTSMYQHTSQYFPCVILGIQGEGGKMKFKVRLTESGGIVDGVHHSLVRSISPDAASGPQAIAVGDDCEVRVPRTPAQDRSFKCCLKYDINLLYGNRWSNVWMLTKPPPDRSGRPGRRYDGSGWCITERAISSITKGSYKLLDLGRIYPDILEKRVEDIDWMGDVVRPCKADRRPPMSPIQFDAAIRDVHFQSGADVQVVQNIYKHAYNISIATVCYLSFSDLSWTDADLEAFATTLRDCRFLHGLDLSGQDITDRGVRSLLSTLKRLRRLQFLDLSDTRVSYTSICDVWESLPNLQALNWSLADMNERRSVLEFDPVLAIGQELPQPIPSLPGSAECDYAIDLS